MSYQEMPWMSEGQGSPWPTSIEAEGCVPLPEDWTYRHDIVLRDAAENGTDFSRVRFSVKKRPPLRTLQNRWFALLYDPEISRQFCEATAGHVRAAPKKIAWSEFEETVLLEKIEHPQSIISFDKLLERYRGDFNQQRNAKQLESHYQKLRSSALHLEQNAPRATPPPHTTPVPIPSATAPSPVNGGVAQLRKLFALNSSPDLTEARQQLTTALEARPHLHGNPSNAAAVWGVIITESKRWVLERTQMTVGVGEQGVDVDLSDLTHNQQLLRPCKILFERQGEERVVVRNVGPVVVVVAGEPLSPGAEMLIRSNCCLDVCGVILLVELIPCPVPMTMNEASHIIATIG